MTIKEHIKERYPNESTELIARDLNIPIKRVYYIAYSMGIKKSSEYLNPGHSNLETYGTSTRFKKGSVPPNKGLPMPKHVYDKVKPTMFKKGNKPHNTQPVGTIHYRDDRGGKTYAYIKIADSDWRLMHRVVWEQHNGPIPRGHIVRFKDGNTMNWDIANLEMISQHNNMELNTIQRYPDEVQQVMKLNCKLKRKINGKKQNQ